TAHLEGLGTVEAIAREKASLAFALEGGGVVYAGADSPRLLAALAGLKSRLVRYGLGANADVRPTRVESLGEQGSRFEVEGYPPIQLALVGVHQVANALAAIAVARDAGLDPAAVATALAAYRPTRGRMELRHDNGATLLVDCYNANPDATRLALETLASWPGAGRRIALLGDMLELGERAAALHRETGAAVRGAELWAVGRYASEYAAGARTAGATVRVLASIEEARAALREALAPGVTVLLKASRGAALERVLESSGMGH
ncbi:MAG: glutamate ligase domain-containing protein, partial [Candidatus Eiseniibacteriota bacterium]